MSRLLLAAVALATILPATVRGQQEERVQRWLANCESRWNGGSRARFCDARVSTIPATATVSVDGGLNGSVAFHGAPRSDIKVIALIETWAPGSAEARAMARDIRVLADGGHIRAEGPESRGRASWSVSFEVYVPTRSDLEASTHNGGVFAENVQGKLDFEAMNGGIRLDAVGGDVHAETTNGGVSASLYGQSWNGRGLDLRTTNGGVDLTIPRGYNARLETGTVNGGFRLDFPVTVQGMMGKHLTTQLGSGGPLVRAVTTNGGVRIRER